MYQKNFQADSLHHQSLFGTLPPSHPQPGSTVEYNATDWFEVCDLHIFFSAFIIHLGVEWAASMTLAAGL